MADKRQLPEAGGSPPSPGSTSLVVKKARHDGALISASVAPGGGCTLSVPGGSVPRTSDLLAPIMKLSGHQGEVLTGRFSPCGSFLATGGFDKDLMLWQVFDGCRNFCVLRGHSKAVLQLAWGHDSTRIYSASADKTLVVWDAEYGERVARLTGHTSHVNSVAAARQAPHMLVSGCAPSLRASRARRLSRPLPPTRRLTFLATDARARTARSPLPSRSSNDSTCRIWDARVRGPVRTLRTRYESTAVEVSADGGRLFGGGLENIVRVYDLRKGGDDEADDNVAFELQGHTDTITGSQPRIAAKPFLAPRAADARARLAVARTRRIPARRTR
jgi:Prp8 binding protein